MAEEFYDANNKPLTGTFYRLIDETLRREITRSFPFGENAQVILYPHWDEDQLVDMLILAPNYDGFDMTHLNEKFDPRLSGKISPIEGKMLSCIEFVHHWIQVRIPHGTAAQNEYPAF